MKKALISPNENNRICEVRDTDFEVAEPLVWLNCPDDCTTQWTYSEGVFSPPVPVVPEPPTADENKAAAAQLLRDTDWVELPSVSDPSVTPHLLNTNEFLNYRSALRAIAVNPTAGELSWPVMPQEQWSA